MINWGSIYINQKTKDQDEKVIELQGWCLSLAGVKLKSFKVIKAAIKRS
jgi:hypothetical protein